jgi:hypothetical protein
MAENQKNYEELKEAIHEVNEHIAGRLQLQSAEDWFAELRRENVE